MPETYTSDWQRVHNGDDQPYDVPGDQRVLSAEVRWRGVSEEYTRDHNEIRNVQDFGRTPTAQTSIPTAPSNATNVSYHVEFTFATSNVSESFVVQLSGGDFYGSVVVGPNGGQETHDVTVDNGRTALASVNTGDEPSQGTITLFVRAITTYRQTRTRTTDDPSVSLGGDSFSAPGTLGGDETTGWVAIDGIQSGANTFSHSIGGSEDADFQFRYSYTSNAAVPTATASETTAATARATDLVAEPAPAATGTTTAQLATGAETTGWYVDLLDRDGRIRQLPSTALLSVDIKAEHTAAWGVTIETPPILDLDDYRGGSMRLKYAGEMQLRCPEIVGRSRGDDGTLTIDGLGAAADLKTDPVERTFDDVFVHDAARTLLREDARIPAGQMEVYEPPARPVENESVQSADTRREFADILAKRSRNESGQFENEAGGESPNWAASDPFEFAGAAGGSNEGVRTTKTCALLEAETYADAENVAVESATGASGGDAVSFADGESATYTVGFDHEIPEGSASVAIRARAADITGTGGTTTLRAAADDQELFSFPASRAGIGGPWTWLFFDTDYTPGTDEFSLTLGVSQAGGVRLDVDCLAVYDDRFGYTFPAETDANDALAGPEPYPDAAALRFRAAAAGIGLDEATARVTMDHDGEGDVVGLEYTNDRGASSETITGTAGSHTAAFGATTARLRPTVSLSRWSDGRTETPTQGNRPQTLTSIETTVSGNAIPVIDSRSFSSTTVFDALQTLCNDYGFHWAVKHGQRRETFAIEVFERGDPSLRRELPASAVTLDYDESAAAEDYANEVTVVGAAIPGEGGARYRWTERAPEEIEAFGREPAPRIENDDLRTENDCRAVARAELAERLDEDERGGKLSVTPALVEPGYPYRVREWEDEAADYPGWGESWGESWGGPTHVYATLGTAGLGESAGSAGPTDLDFAVRSGVLAALVEGF